MNNVPTNDQHPELAVAIVGIAGRFPGADSVSELWSNLIAGVESLRALSADELLALGVDPELIGSPGYVPVAGALSDVKGFDAEFFGYSPREAELMDPQHRVFLECAWSALEDAAVVPERTSGAVGVFAGCGPASYLIFNLVPHAELMAHDNLLSLMNGNDKDSLVTRVAYKLNLKGPALTVQTACSTSLVAVHVACQNLIAGQCDVALAGGVTVLMPERTGYVFHNGEITSPDGHCRAFAERAQGTVFSSGAGVVVLKRLEDALTDGSHIYAVIRGTAINNDGAEKIGFTAPSIAGQAEVIAMAHAMADIDPRSISYVEAHGTGTPVGDPAEVHGLCRAFGLDAPDRQFCALGSLKTNIGHLDTAAGVAGLIKAALALDRGMLPPSLHFERANPQIRFEDTPFFVNDRLRAWPRTETPRRAGVSSFGIGGTNAHVVLEEAPPRPASARRPLELLPLSARTPAALAQVAARLAAHLEATGADLPDVAHTLQVGRRALSYRATVVCADVAGAIAGLRELTPVPAVAGAADGVVFLFPGQGSQYAGMARGLYRALPVFRAALDECAEPLAPLLERDLRDLLFDDGPGAALLDRTDLTQPALFAVEYALAQQWLRWGVRPAALAGHSVGEYVAACLAGVFSLADGLRLIAARGRLMQATPRGGMLAIAAPPAEVAAWLGDALDLAAVNGDRQCVVAGPRPAIAALHARLEASHVLTRVLPSQRAFHSRLMEPILAAFEDEVARTALSAPTLPLVSNLTGQWMTAHEATSPRYWAEHLRGAVRFADNVRCLDAGGGTPFVEVGPGRTLSGLVRASLASPQDRLTVPSLLPPHANRSEHQQLLSALGQVWACGVDVDWSALNPESPARRVPLPAYPFERQEYWIDPPARRGQADASQVAAARPPGPHSHDSAASGPTAPRARHQRPALGVSYAPPGDDLERQLAGICEDLLGIGGIGMNDSFFDLGGDSLVAVRLVARIRERLDVDLDVRALFDCATIARLANRLRDAQKAVEAECDLSRLMELVEHMSDEEAEAMLAKWPELQALGTASEQRRTTEPPMAIVRRRGS
jgi:phthiocerol/phenolphthiocerol synthesis type-I polyketide synthase E